jgi:CRISPR/Cas system-associated endonuclease Cas3-HD
MKIHPVGAELFHADRRTEEQADTTKLIIAFHSISKTPKNYQGRILENAVHIYQKALRSNPEDDIFRSYYHEIIKSCIFTIFYCLQHDYLRIITN